MTDIYRPASDQKVDVDVGGRTVTVPKGGLYDRYRMDTDLDEIARDPRVSGVEFFRSLPKRSVDSPVGMTLTPNFYYRSSIAQLTMIAPTRAIRKRLPEELAPLEIAPGLGIISAVFYRYDVCDIDPYTEALVAIVVRPPRHGRLGFVDLAAELGNDAAYAYVLSLPVNTEIAQVRGHRVYGMPKWVTSLDVEIDDNRTSARVANDSGGTDLSMSVVTPKQRSYATGTHVSSLTALNKIGGAWHTSLSQTNVLTAGRALFPRNVDLHVGEGRLADDIRSLKPIKTIRLDVLTEAQMALNVPTPTSVPERG